MPLRRDPVPNLIGGISQQPPAVRRKDKCEATTNCWPSGVDGATKRQPSKHIKNLLAAAGASGNYRWHFINRSSTEQYLLVFKNGAVQAFDAITGNSRVVRDIPATSFAYLGGATVPATDVVPYTVADYTFVLNKGTTVAMAATASAAPATLNEAYIFVRQGNYKTNYTIRVKQGALDHTTATQTWNGTAVVGGELNSIKTDDIAADLVTKLGAMFVTFGYSVSLLRTGSVIRLRSSSTVAAIEPTDSIGDSVLSVVWNTVPRVAGFLPKICTDGYKVKVVGDAEIAADDYYVKFVANETGAFGPGHWVEDIGYSQEIRLNATTMPHILTRRFDNAGGAITGTAFQAYFDWDVAPWLDKTVGDTLLVPRPSFVGRTINELFWFKERLGFLSDDRIVMTETREPFNWWRTTMYTVGDHEPIDVTVNHYPVALLTQAIPYNENMFIKSAHTEFILRGGEILSPRTVQVVEASVFENYSDVLPIAAGRTLFVAYKRGDYSGVREFFQVGDTQLYDSSDVTADVPRFIAGKITWMSCSTLEETLICKSANSPTNVLSVYKYIWQGEQKILSGWGAWSFDTGCTIRHFAFLDNTLYLVMERASGTWLEKVDVVTGLVDTGVTWVSYLDRRVDQTQVTGLAFAAGNTTFTLPYDPGASNVLQVVRKSNGLIYNATNVGAVVTIVGIDLTAVPFWTGIQYFQIYQFTQPVQKMVNPESQRGSTVPASNAQQIAKRLSVEYANSGQFYCVVQIGTRSAQIMYIPAGGNAYGSNFNTALSLATGSADLPIHGRCQDVVCYLINTNPWPANWSSATWTILEYERGARG